MNCPEVAAARFIETKDDPMPDLTFILTGADAIDWAMVIAWVRLVVVGAKLAREA